MGAVDTPLVVGAGVCAAVDIASGTLAPLFTEYVVESRLLGVAALRATAPDVPVKVGMVVPYTGVTLAMVEMVSAATILLDAARELVLNTSDANTITVDTDLGGITPDADRVTPGC